MHHGGPSDKINRYRRQALLTIGSAVGALGWIPLYAGDLPADAKKTSPSVALGYWLSASPLPDYGKVRAEWNCNQAQNIACRTGVAAGALRDAQHLVGKPGEYRLRVAGAGLTAPLRLDADHAGGRHRLWQAWRDGDKLAFASPARAKWSASTSGSLPLIVSYRDGSNHRVEVPARPGVYALLIDEGVAKPAWSQLALIAPEPSAPLDLRLRDASGNAPAHVLLVVDHALDAATA